MRFRLHVPSTSPFLWTAPLIFLTNILMDRMGVQPILPFEVIITIDTMLNVDRHGDVTCKGTFNIKIRPGVGGGGVTDFF